MLSKINAAGEFIKKQEEEMEKAQAWANEQAQAANSQLAQQMLKDMPELQAAVAMFSSDGIPVDHLRKGIMGVHSDPTHPDPNPKDPKNAGLGYNDPLVKEAISGACCFRCERRGGLCCRNALCCVPAMFNMLCCCCDIVGMPEYADYFGSRSAIKVAPEPEGPEPVYGRKGELIILLSAPGSAHSWAADKDSRSPAPFPGLGISQYFIKLAEDKSKTQGTFIACPVHFDNGHPKADHWKAYWDANMEKALTMAKWHHRDEQGNLIRKVTYVLVEGGGEGSKGERNVVNLAIELGTATTMLNAVISMVMCLAGVMGCCAMPDDNWACWFQCGSRCAGCRACAYINGSCQRLFCAPILLGMFCLPCLPCIWEYVPSRGPEDAYRSYKTVVVSAEVLKRYLVDKEGELEMFAGISKGKQAQPLGEGTEEQMRMWEALDPTIRFDSAMQHRPMPPAAGEGEGGSFCSMSSARAAMVGLAAAASFNMAQRAQHSGPMAPPVPSASMWR